MTKTLKFEPLMVVREHPGTRRTLHWMCGGEFDTIEGAMEAAKRHFEKRMENERRGFYELDVLVEFRIVVRTVKSKKRSRR